MTLVCGVELPLAVGGVIITCVSLAVLWARVMAKGAPSKVTDFAVLFVLVGFAFVVIALVMTALAVTLWGGCV